MFELLLFQLVCSVVKRQRRHAKINVLHKLLLIHKRREFNLFEFTTLFQKHSRPFASSHQIPKHRKRWQKHLATSRNENAVQLRKHSVEIVEKHHAHGVEKRRQTSPQNVRTKNSFQIHLLSRLHQVQMNFTENEILLQKVVLKQHHPKINESPCFCIQIQMSPHRSASFPEFRSTKLSKTSQHSHRANYMQET